MPAAKDLRVAPISSADGNRFIRRTHYSRKVVPNSQLHFGVFLDDRLLGVMQFGPSMDKGNMLGLVRDTAWNNFIELNRLAFTDALPRNSESRALAVAFRLIKKNYPHIEWVVSYADGTCCGDGTIYRASGFVLTGIRPNKTIYEFPDGERVADLGIKTGWAWQKEKFGRTLHGTDAMHEAKRLGAVVAHGYQLRYIYFLHEAARARLAVPVIPFSKIEEIGATMYRGERPDKASEVGNDRPPPVQRRCDTDPDAPPSPPAPPAR